ncbi:hypothetical protein EDC94DRAFT_679946 [Helicostylum pulchrum]|nr:hypothetical protein EDC94DRAFT_679946 [Helicostylum pulchrum]
MSNIRHIRQCLAADFQRKQQCFPHGQFGIMTSLIRISAEIDCLKKKWAQREKYSGYLFLSTDKTPYLLFNKKPIIHTLIILSSISSVFLQCELGCCRLYLETKRSNHYSSRSAIYQAVKKTFKEVIFDATACFIIVLVLYILVRSDQQLCWEKIQVIQCGYVKSFTIIDPRPFEVAVDLSRGGEYYTKI